MAERRRAMVRGEEVKKIPTEEVLARPDVPPVQGECSTCVFKREMAKKLVTRAEDAAKRAAEDARKQAAIDAFFRRQRIRFEYQYDNIR